MLKLLGILWIVAGDIFLLRYLAEKNKQKIQCLEEMLRFIGNLTCDINELKIPLEEAVDKQETIGYFTKILCQNFQKAKSSHSIREALLLSTNALPALDDASKKILTDYLKIPGTLPKEATEEYYRVAKRDLDCLLIKEKENLQTSKKLITGIVYAASGLTVILLI